LHYVGGSVDDAHLEHILDNSGSNGWTAETWEDQDIGAGIEYE